MNPPLRHHLAFSWPFLGVSTKGGTGNTCTVASHVRTAPCRLCRRKVRRAGTRRGSVCSRRTTSFGSLCTGVILRAAAAAPLGKRCSMARQESTPLGRCGECTERSHRRSPVCRAPSGGGPACICCARGVCSRRTAREPQLRRHRRSMWRAWCAGRPPASSVGRTCRRPAALRRWRRGLSSPRRVRSIGMLGAGPRRVVVAYYSIGTRPHSLYSTIASPGASLRRHRGQ